MIDNPGSFRDPAGQVFIRDKKIYRCIFDQGVNQFMAARDAGVFDTLIKRGLLISHEEIEVMDWTPHGTVFCLNHPRIPMVSYPWEWPFSMLKDAALIHLNAMEALIPLGFWLRDASSFNVQFDGQVLRLIDTLSVGRRRPDSPWVAYGQFCSHFLGPLALAAYGDVRMLSLWRNYLNGYPLDLVCKFLPFWQKFKPGLFMHLILHARAQNMADRKEDIGKTPHSKTGKVSDRGLLGILKSLTRTVENIKWKRKSEIWEEYGEIRTYQQEDVVKKSEFVEKVVTQLKPEIVWDLGANTGEFSLIAASSGAFVVSIDGDAACSEYVYRKYVRESTGKRILPLTMDLANPSPGLGWRGQERCSLEERGPADLVLALALVHHLVFSCCVPLIKIAEWLGNLGENLVVEFVPPTDPMVRKLMLNREEDHLPYDLNEFKNAFQKIFDIEYQMNLQNGRSLYLCKRKVQHA